MFRLCCCLSLLAGLAALSAPLQAADQPPHAKIDPKALEAMRAMGKYLDGLNKFAIVAEETVDEPNHESGICIQISYDRKVTINRPNGVHSTTSGDQERCFYYDGKSCTIHERDKNMYVTMPAPDTIEKTMDLLNEKYGVSVPLAELLMRKPDAMMMEKVDRGHYIGLHQVEGVKCHHLAFSQRDIDWQIWIEAGEKPLPKKLVITYTKMDGDPQYTAVIKKWDLNPALKPGCFDFKAPPGATKMDTFNPNAGRDK